MDEDQKRLGRGGILARVDLIITEPVPQRRDVLQERLLADLDGLPSALEQLSVLDDLVFLVRATIVSMRGGGATAADDAAARRPARLALSNARGLARLMHARRQVLLQALRDGARTDSGQPGVQERGPESLALRRNRLNRRVDAMLRLLAPPRGGGGPV